MIGNIENIDEYIDEYWSETAQADKLYRAIRLNDLAQVERLRAEGVGLSEHIKGMLRTGGGNLVAKGGNEYAMDWYDFICGFENYDPDELVSLFENLRRELGEPIHYSDTIYTNLHDMFTHKIFKSFLNCFDNKKMPKKWILRGLVDKDDAECLAMTAERGWLRLAKQREELIAYSQKKNSTECTAFLLDFKNRTVDLAAEREKAEKKAERELNAAPDSVTALKMLWSWKKRENGGGLIITSYKGNSTEITVPEKIGKETVTALGVAFSPNTRVSREIGVFRKTITKVTLPKTITEIGSDTFRGCGKLESVNIPDAVTEIGAGAFYLCQALKEINIPNGITEIRYDTFWDCRSLRSVNIPESVKSIGASAFWGCEIFEEITLPKDLNKIDQTAFIQCVNLKAVELPAALKEIPYGCFANCAGLKSIAIPNGVTVISDSAFYNCENLEHIEIPSTAEKIGDRAFWHCKALKTVVVPEGVREIGIMAFANNNLKRVELPRSVAKIANYTEKGKLPKTIFYGSENVKAVVYPKSYAERYCKRNGIPFVYKED